MLVKVHPSPQPSPQPSPVTRRQSHVDTAVANTNTLRCQRRYRLCHLLSLKIPKKGKSRFLFNPFFKPLTSTFFYYLPYIAGNLEEKMGCNWCSTCKRSEILQTST